MGYDIKLLIISLVVVSCPIKTVRKRSLHRVALLTNVIDEVDLPHVVYMFEPFKELRPTCYPLGYY